MEENGTYRWTPPNVPKAPKMPKEFKVPKIKPAVIIAIVLVAVIALASLSCFYTVDDKQQAVVTTFGKVTDIADAGVHFKIPLASSRYRKWM